MHRDICASTSSGAISYKAYLRALFFHSQYLAQVEVEYGEAETGRLEALVLHSAICQAMGMLCVSINTHGNKLGLEWWPMPVMLVSVRRLTEENYQLEATLSYVVSLRIDSDTQ